MTHVRNLTHNGATVRNLTSQDELVALLDEATDAVMRHRPGFVTAMLADPVCREHMAGAAAMASFEPLLYRVCSTHR